MSYDISVCYINEKSTEYNVGNYKICKIAQDARLISDKRFHVIDSCSVLSSVETSKKIIGSTHLTAICKCDEDTRMNNSLQATI